MGICVHCAAACVHVCIFVCSHVYICVHVYVHTCMHTRVHVVMNMCVCMYVLCVHVCVCAYVGTYVLVCMYTETKEGHLVSYSVTLLYSLTELRAPVHLFFLWLSWQIANLNDSPLSAFSMSGLQAM